MKELAEFIAIMVAVVGGVFGGICGVMFPLVNHDAHVQCLRLREQTGLDTRTVGVIDPSCYVHDGDRWVPSDRWLYNHPVGVK